MRMGNIISKKWLIFWLAALVGCGVGVEGAIDLENSSDDIPMKTVSATVMVPGTNSASISKAMDLSMDVSTVPEVPAADHLAVVENFITGERCGSQAVGSDGIVYVSAVATCIEETIDSDPTRTTLILKAFAPGDSNEVVVEKLIDVADTTAEEIAADNVSLDDMIALQLIRASLGVDNSAADDPSAVEMLRSNAFRPGCFNTFTRGLVTDSVSSGEGMEGPIGSLKEAFKCLMSSGVRANALGYNSYPEMIRDMADGGLDDSAMASILNAIGSANCGAQIDADKIRTANDALSGIRQAAAAQIAGDETTCGRMTDTNEISAWKEAYKSIDPEKLKPANYEAYVPTMDQLKRTMEVARSINDYAAFYPARAKAMWGVFESFEAADSDDSDIDSEIRRTTMDLIKAADFSNMTTSAYKSFGMTCANITISSADDPVVYSNLRSDPAKYSNYVGAQIVNGSDSSTITNSWSSIYYTLETHGSHFDTCRSQYGGMYDSSCYSGYGIEDIAGVLSVVSTSPIDDATNVPPNGAISATFSKKLSIGSAVAATFTVMKGDNLAASGIVSASDKTATFAPSTSLAFNTQYTATLTTGIRDLSWTNLREAYSWTFTTSNEPDTTPPTISSTNPANGAANSGINAVTATFDEVMDVSTMNADNFSLSTGGNNVAGTVSFSGVTATLAPSTNLAYNTSYTATITTDVRDLSGNALAANHDWTFTTRPASGALDTSFGTGGKVTTAMSTGADSVVSVVVQSDGKIVTAGLATNTTSDFAIARYNSNGSLDTTFGTGGKVTTDINNGTDWPAALLIQSDGKYVEVGRAGNATWDFGLVRYNTDGSLDTTFGTGGKVSTAISATANDQPIAAAIQSDGKILTGGWATSGANTAAALVRYNTDGSLDTTFDSDGIVTTSTGSGQNTQIYGLAVQSDGKIVGGGLSRNGTSSQLTFVILRYNADGSLDTTFDSDGIVTTDIENATADYANSVAIQPDGKIVAAGQAKSPTDFAVIRYNTDGSLDTSFGTAGIVTTAIGGGADTARAVKIQSDGKIVLAGSANNGTNDDFALVRYNSNGSLDSTFGTGGKVTTAIGNAADVINRAMQIQTDGKIIVGGKSNNGTDDDFALARYWP